MTEVRRLALRVGPPQEEEPAYGLFCRLAARPGYADARELALRLELPFPEIVSGRERRHVETLAGLPSGALEAGTVRYADGEALVGAHVMPRKDWAMTPARVCPGCLSDDLEAAASDVVPHRRFWWDYKAIDVCPRHSIALQHRCQHCNQLHRPWRTDLLHCSCGASVLKGASDPADPGAVRADRYILARLLGRPHRKLAVLDDIPLRQVQTTMLVVGASANEGRLSLSDLDLGQRLSAKADAYRSFRNWPRNFRRKLDGLRQEVPTGETEGASDSISPYRRYQHVLASYLIGEAHAPIRDEYERHFLGKVPAGVGTRIFGRLAADSVRVTIAAAKDYCGIHSNSTRLPPVLRDLGLLGPRCRDLAEVTIPRKSLPWVRVALENSLGPATAADMLGITRVALEDLIKGGQVEALRNEYDQGPRITKASIDYLLYDLAYGVDGSAVPDEPLVSFAKAAMSPDGEGGTTGFEVLVRAVRAGALPIVARRLEGRGLDALLISRAALSRWRWSRRPGLNNKDAALFLRVTASEVPRLVRLGLLTDTSPGARGYLRSDLEAFGRVYAKGSECASMARVPISQVAGLLDALGITPSAMPPHTAGRYYARTVRLEAELADVAARKGTLRDWLARRPRTTENASASNGSPGDDGCPAHESTGRALQDGVAS